jgi:uncharacterized membrane protein
MWSWFTFWLLLHVLTAIAAFGPTFAFPLIASFAKKDPRYAEVITDVMHQIEIKITIPAAVVMPFLGLALIYTGHFNLWKSTWLLISIALYIVAFFFSVLVQQRNSVKMLRLIEAASPADASAVGASGPSPEMVALGKRLDLGGMLITVLLVAIIVLMVWRPGSAFV